MIRTTVFMLTNVKYVARAVTVLSIARERGTDLASEKILGINFMDTGL